jgi:Carboxypeptidase regulatory-like domain
MRGLRGIAWCVVVLVMVLATSRSASAQLTTGSLAGNVKDAQGGVIPGATVTLVSETRGTRSVPVVTNATGDFVFPNLPADTYTIEVEMSSFKTLKQSGIQVNPGPQVSIGALTLEIGGATETVSVKGESPVIQTASGERSFAIPTQTVENLPFASRSFLQLGQLAPGVVMNGVQVQRLGSIVQSTTVMMDGVSTMDTGSNGAIVQMNVESIAEVKVLVQGYQAEYGRSSGLQITAVSKSGTNRFHGSLYNVRRDSDWNANSKTNILNSAPKPILQQQEIGYSIGGPIGKAGGNNKIFFFHALEFLPRTGGNDVVNYRMPTELERAGDFSQSRDNLGNLYPYIKDPNLQGTCSAADQTACFKDGGVLGRIPADRLYQPGLNILKMWPLPNNASTATGANYAITRPSESILGYQPAVRVDYQPMPSLRLSVKYQGAIQRQQVFNGTIPGFNDSKMVHPRIGTEGVTVNYSLNPTTFIEATYGRAGNELAACGPTPSFCGNTAVPTNDISNLNNAGLAGLPLLFPDALVLNKDYYAYSILTEAKVPFFDGTRILRVPSFSWGNRILSGTNLTTGTAPPNINFPGFLNINTTQDVVASLTKVMGRHTIKTGFYNSHSLKRENNVQGAADNFGSLNFQQDTVGTNPFDTSFGFANAAIGSFSSFSQASRYVEGTFTYNNTEGYIQDNWKVNNKLTLDYGVRLVHAQPQHDALLQSGNFLPDKWVQSQAPTLYVAGCVNDANPCTGTNRQAKNPLTGQLLGPNSILAIGTLVPNTGNLTNGLFQSGQGIAKTTYTFPMLNVGPRFGVAYDVTGKQQLVLRGAWGLYFDRPRPGDAQALVGNPPGGSRIITVRYGQLQSLTSGGLSTVSPPGITVFQYEAKLPTSMQFSAGAQMLLPWSTSLDVSYVGLHSWNDQQPWNINSIDLGTAFLSSSQDLTLAASTTPGATSYAATNPDLVRAYRGYASMASTSRFYEGWRTYHSLQFSLNRRFKDGLQFGFNDTIQLYDEARVAPRFDHRADGSYVRRADEAEAQKLLGNQFPGNAGTGTPALAGASTHVMKGSAVWDLPDLKSDSTGLKILGYVINDWQLSTIWTGLTGAPYSVTYSYQSGGGNVNLTGSPDFGGRIRIVGDPGKGCSSDPYRQFNAAAFQGPLVGSVGLESGNDYLKGCFSSTLDLSIARNIRLGGGRVLQLRADMFNAPNSAQITGRQTSLTLTNPTDPVTPQNLPYDPATGQILPNRVRPNQAGFGAVNSYQAARNIQGYIRFSF